MAVTPIQARCRRCDDDFRLYEVLDHRRGTCPHCGWMLSPDWTAKLLEDAAVADIAQRHLVGSLRNLRNLPGNVLLRPHTVLRNLFEEVGWERDLAENPEVLRDELRQLRRLLDAWELLDPVVAAAQPARTRFRRAIDWIIGRPTELTVSGSTQPPRPVDGEADPPVIDDHEPAARHAPQVAKAS